MTKAFETTCVSTFGAPDITFKFDGGTCRAELVGAKLYAEASREDGGIDLRVTDASGFVLADLVLNKRAERNDTENVTDIGSALLWSHWRWFVARNASMSADAGKLTEQSE